MTTTPTCGAAIQRYKIGYHADEWGQRSSTPSGIPDASGSWVRYADHVTALAAGQATAAQQGAYAALPESFLEIPDVQDESGINAYYSREVVLECIDAALASHGQAPAGAGVPTEQQILEAAFAPAQPAAEASRFGSPELQAMIIARCVEKDQADSGFDYTTAADFLSGKTVSDEALRKFVAASRGAHDARAALHARMLSLQGELASRAAEIALLKRSLLDAEAAPQQAMWRHIETAPKDGQAILVTDGMDCHCVEWDEEFDWWTVDDNKLGPFRLRGSAPTHWMPLPPAHGPADGESNG